eukprot:ctg_3022.g692
MIQRMLRDEFAGLTVLSIAHRLEDVIHYDRVMVFDDGRIAELDTPQNLLADRQSIFTALVEGTGEAGARHLKKMAHTTASPAPSQRRAAGTGNAARREGAPPQSGRCGPGACAAAAVAGREWQPATRSAGAPDAWIPPRRLCCLGTRTVFRLSGGAGLRSERLVSGVGRSFAALVLSPLLVQQPLQRAPLFGQVHRQRRIGPRRCGRRRRTRTTAVADQVERIVAERT